MHRREWILLAVFALVLSFVVQKRRTSRLRLLRDAIGNEALVLQGTVGPRRLLFMVDTAYAGAPVLSTSYLAAQTRVRASHDVQREYHDTIEALQTPVGEGERLAAVQAFVAAAPCRSYTSGCTMRLMGIGTTSEAQSDMLLCPVARFSGDAMPADVFVTNPLPTSVHIITMDYLLHRAPCVLLPRRQELMWHVSNLVLHRTFHFLKPTFVGGAPRVPMTVGGTVFQIVVDTGASAALSLAADSFARIATCQNTQHTAQQRGVNGERICSTVVTAHVEVGPIRVGDVSVFVNASNVEGADGYAGMGLLRCLDVWIAAHEIGFRANGLKPKASSALRPGACERAFQCPKLAAKA